MIDNVCMCIETEFISKVRTKHNVAVYGAANIAIKGEMQLYVVLY